MRIEIDESGSQPFAHAQGYRRRLTQPSVHKDRASSTQRWVLQGLERLHPALLIVRCGPKVSFQAGVMSFKPDNIQIAIFLRSQPSRTALSLWAMLEAGDPSDFTTVAPGHTQVQGVVEGLLILLIVQNDVPRVDVTVAAVPTPHPDLPPFPFSNFQNAVDAAVKFSTKLLPNLNVERLATVIQANVFTNTKSEAAKLVADAIGKPDFNKDVEDIHFQVVVPQPIKVPYANRINRLVRWQTIQLDFSYSSGGVPLPAGNLPARKIGAQLYVDAFWETAAPLDTEGALTAMHEVVASASHIIEVGYDAL